MRRFDIRDISIVDSLPVYNYDKKILTVGCGRGWLELELCNMGFDVVATDINKYCEWPEELEGLCFKYMDIINPTDTTHYSVVICSQVLEHLIDYKKAFKNMLGLSDIRLIVTVPVKRSFYDPGHVNFWDDNTIDIFRKLSEPYVTSITKIRTKIEDVKLNQWGYLIIVDKRQCYN